MTCEGDISTFLFRKLTLASNGLGINFDLTDSVAEIFKTSKVWSLNFEVEATILTFTEQSWENQNKIGQSNQIKAKN